MCYSFHSILRSYENNIRVEGLLLEGLLAHLCLVTLLTSEECS